MVLLASHKIIASVDFFLFFFRRLLHFCRFFRLIRYRYLIGRHFEQHLHGQHLTAMQDVIGRVAHVGGFCGDDFVGIEVDKLGGDGQPLLLIN